MPRFLGGEGDRRMRDRVLGAGGLLVVAALFAGAPPARAEAWRDEKLGYSLNYPTRWNVIPVDAGDWLVGRFESNREYDIYDRNDRRGGGRHKPYIEVVVIPYPPKADPAPPAEAPGEAGEAPVAPAAPAPPKPAAAAPWKDLKEYMDKTFQARRVGGFHFSGEETAEVSGLKVRQLEITVDKLVNGERRIYGWEFAAEDAYYGVVAEVLVQEEKKLKPELFSCFQSFRTFARKGSLPAITRAGGGAAGGGDAAKDGPKAEEREVTPEELKKKRDDATARVLARIKENLPKDWSIVDGKNYVAVSHADGKYTREVLAHAEALRAWMEQNLGFVGSGYAGKVVIRIYADHDEHEGAVNVKRKSDPDCPEIPTFKHAHRERWGDSPQEQLNKALGSAWFRDKNRALRVSMPAWISFGLNELIGNATFADGKLEFSPDTGEKVGMDRLRRDPKALCPVRLLFTVSSDEFRSLPGAAPESPFFVHFLLLGPGARHPKYRSVLQDYLKNLIFLLDSERPDGAEEREPQNEQEEQEMARKRAEAWRTRERDVMGKLMEKTFRDWSDKDWDAFHAAFVQTLN